MEYFEIYNTYFVCKSGFVFSKQRASIIHPILGPVKQLKGQKNNLGYIKFMLMTLDGKAKWHSLHRLLMEYYKPQEDMHLLEVDHIDRNKQNNDLNNLRWVTHQENCLNRKFKEDHGHWNKNRKVKKSTRKLMSKAKIGEKHPSFTGYYIDPRGSEYASSNMAAILNNTNQMNILRWSKNNKKGWSFKPKTE